MKHISKIIKYSDAYKHLEKKGLIINEMINFDKCKFNAKEKSQLDILFQSFGDIYKEAYNNKNKNDV
tara:strand:- start:546 stop:746 length:201 start_codon:yes stop_codon:yes gene_type:complete